MCPSRLSFRSLLAVGLFLALPATAAAQRPSGSSPGWLPAQAGLHMGYDNNANATVVGAQLRVPVIPTGHVELLPSSDVTFLPGLKEYQLNADAVFVTGGRSGGLYGGGGLALRNSIFTGGGERETRSGANVVVGLTTRGRLGGVPMGIQLEGRWVFLDAEFDPRLFTFGVNLPLWGWGSRDGGRF